MFTGIIQHIGTVESLVYQGNNAQLEIGCSLDTSDIYSGDSIAINGTCLTVASFTKGLTARLVFDLGPETLEKTTLGNLRFLQSVHVEKALRLSDRLGGHLVQGHIDGVGVLVSRDYEGSALKLHFTCNKDILSLCVYKGSISVDGVSLTINQVYETGFDTCLIPLTLQKTCLDSYPISHRVNLENDLIGKYVKRLLKHKEELPQITWNLLDNANFTEKRRTNCK
jgi:riboflavin synthase